MTPSGRYTEAELQRVKEKASKLLSLARRGVGGEATNAATLLKKTLERYGLTEADLAIEGEPQPYRFGFADRYERELLLQVVKRVLNTKAVPGERHKGPKAITFQLTPFQHAEVDLLYTVFRPAWKEEHRRLFIAFIGRNEIYERTAGQAKPDLDPWDQYMIQEMMAGMRRTAVPRGLLTDGRPQ